MELVLQYKLGHVDHDQSGIKKELFKKCHALIEKNPPDFLLFVCKFSLTNFWLSLYEKKKILTKLLVKNVTIKFVNLVTF